MQLDRASNTKFTTRESSVNIHHGRQATEWVIDITMYADIDKASLCFKELWVESTYGSGDYKTRKEVPWCGKYSGKIIEKFWFGVKETAIMPE